MNNELDEYEIGEVGAKKPSYADGIIDIWINNHDAITSLTLDEAKKLGEYLIEISSEE